MRGFLAVVVGIALLAVAPVASAQAGVPDGTVAMRSDGTVFIVLGGRKHQLNFATLSDEVLAALPDGEPLDGQVPVALIAEPAAPAPAPAGQRVAAGRYALTVMEVRDPAISDNMFIKPEAGNRFVAVLVRVENLSNEPAPYNPLYFKLRDAAGFEYNASLFAAAEPSLKAGELPAGDSALGWVTFEIGEAARPTSLKYKPLILFGTDPELIVPLP